MSNTTDRRLGRRAERLARKRETHELVEEHRMDVILDAEELAEIHREWNEWDAAHPYPARLHGDGDPFDEWDPEPYDDTPYDDDDWDAERSSYGRDPLDPLY